MSCQETANSSFIVRVYRHPARAALGPIALALGIASLGATAAPPKEGDYRATGCYHGPAYVNTLSNDVMAGSYGLVGTVMAKEDDLEQRFRQVQRRLANAQW